MTPPAVAMFIGRTEFLDPFVELDRTQKRKP